MKRRYTYDDGRPYEWTERVRIAPQAYKPEPWSDVLREAFWLLCLVVVAIAITSVS